MKYNRILLKISGESLGGDEQKGIDADVLHYFAGEIKAISEKGVQTAVVIGGGNIFRGLQGASKGFDRIQGDYMGMLATVINSMALQGELEVNGIFLFHFLPTFSNPQHFLLCKNTAYAALRFYLQFQLPI